jgi:hypothetical protein
MGISGRYIAVSMGRGTFKFMEGLGNLKTP